MPKYWSFLRRVAVVTVFIGFLQPIIKAALTFPSLEGPVQTEATWSHRWICRDTLPSRLRCSSDHSIHPGKPYAHIRTSPSGCPYFHRSGCIRIFIMPLFRKVKKASAHRFHSAPRFLSHRTVHRYGPIVSESPAKLIAFRGFYRIFRLSFLEASTSHLSSTSYLGFIFYTEIPHLHISF